MPSDTSMSIDNTISRSDITKEELIDDVIDIADGRLSKSSKAGLANASFTSPEHAPKNADTVLNKPAGAVQRELLFINKSRPIPEQIALESPLPHDPDMDIPNVKVTK